MLSVRGAAPVPGEAPRECSYPRDVGNFEQPELPIDGAVPNYFRVPRSNKGGSIVRLVNEVLPAFEASKHATLLTGRQVTRLVTLDGTRVDHIQTLDRDGRLVRIGARWFEMPQVLESWYMIFHQQPFAEEIVGSTRAATETYLRHFLRHWSHDTDVFPDDEIAEFVEAYPQPGAIRGGFNCYRAAFRGGGPGGDGPITTPTLVLWGDSDPILRYEWSDKLGEAFSDHTLKKIERVGHFMHRESPERINKEVIDFLA